MKTAQKQDLAQRYLDVARVIILAIDSDQTVSLINKKGCEVLGYEQSEVLGKNWFENFIPERIRAEIQTVFAQLVKGEGASVEYVENQVLTKQGEERLVAWHNTVLYDREGHITSTLSSGEDITERRQKEEALRRRETEMRAIVDTVVDGIVTIDTQGIIHSFNAAAARIFGYTPEEAVGQNVQMLMPDQDAANHDRYLSNYVSSGQRKIIGIGREVRGKRKDGTTFPLYLAVSEVRLDDQLRFTGILRDLTDFKHMQAEVLQAQSLATIGEMAASIAHEIRNPLAGISGAIQVLSEGLEPSHPSRTIMNEVVSQITRLDNVIRQLLMLSKPWNPEKHPCDLAELLEGINRRAEEQKTFRGVRLVMTGEESVVAPVDPSSFEQVIWNILHNAIDAMPEGGEIRYDLDQQPDLAVLTVTDNGTGIPEEFQDRLFHPFFTTKPRGTGLGLAICRKIMLAHGGSINIHSSTNGGTSVRLCFPG